MCENCRPYILRCGCENVCNEKDTFCKVMALLSELEDKLGEEALLSKLRDVFK